MSESLRLRSLLAMGVSAAAILGFAAPAFAQDVTAEDEGTTVGEVVVTAQKREEAIQDVPIAVSAFSQDTLEKAKIDGGPNLVTAIPNVNFSKGNFTGYNFQIRGVGSKLVSGSGDAGTGIHLNNAPMTANNLFEAEFYDVERVEVLRGPQGTLYGRNATGGVVNIITAKPVNDVEAMVRAEIGNYDARKLRAMVNVPLGDLFAIRAAATMLKRDGYGVNTVTGNDADDRELWAARLTLGFNPTDTFRSWLMWDHFEEDDNRSRIGRQFCQKDPGGTQAGLTFSPDAGVAQVQRGFFSQGCLPASLYAPGVSQGTINTQATLGGLFAALSGLQTGDALAGKVQDPDIRNIESAVDPIYQSDTDIFELNVEWDLTDSLTLVSLTSYSELNLFTRQDYSRVVPDIAFNVTPNPINVFGPAIGAAALEGLTNALCGPLPRAPACVAAAAAAFPGVFGGTPAQFGQATYTGIYQGLFPGGVVNDPQVGAYNRFTTFDISSAFTEQWTQELRLQSNFDGPINFNVGGIYLDYRATGDYFVMFNTGTAFYQVNNFLNTGQANCAATNPACVFIDPNATPDRSGHNYYDNYAPYHLKSRAAFGEVYYQMTDNLKWTLGLRYTDDTKIVEAHQVALGIPGSGVLPPPASDPEPLKKVRFQEMTGRFGVDWKPDLGFTDETLLYAFYSKGYKAGGVNPACSFSCNTYPDTFAPEFVSAIELGAKNTLLGGSMMLNLTGFMYDYEGYQVSKIQNRTSINENIDAEIRGLELESIWEPVQNLRLNAAVGWLDTEITGGTSIDTFNRTQGDPNLVVMKTNQAANCVVTLATAQLVLAFSAANPFNILGACPGTAPLPPEGATLYPGGPLASGVGAFGNLFSEGVPVDLTGKELPNAPHWTLSLGAQYTFEFGDWTLTPRADYYKQTETFSRIYNSNADRIDGWENVNATVTLEHEPGGFSIEAYVKNATDEEAITDTYLTDDSSGLFRNAFFTEPRTYGVAVTKRF
jgi:outer membrane receptor protein involved in Fe transport